MSKQKSKEVKSTPEIYQGLSLTIQRPNICIVEDLNGNYSLHNSRADLEKLQSFSALIKDTLSKVWNNFNKFLEENKQTILAYHEQFFKVDPEKNQTIEQTAVMVWNKIISIAKTDLTTAVPIIAGRKSTIGLCEYRAGTEKDDGNLIDPPVSEPKEKQASFPATDAAEPEELPPATLVLSCGFFVGPNAEFSPLPPMANSSKFVLPKITDPASNNFFTTVALYGAT